MPAADHKRVQSNGLYPQHGGMMTSMHKVYKQTSLYFCFVQGSGACPEIPVLVDRAEAQANQVEQGTMD